MNTRTAIIILTTLLQIGELDCMTHNLATVTFWSAPLSRMTVWRYLNRLETMGYVTTTRIEFRKKQATGYYITDKGKAYLERIKDGRRKRVLD